jgi:hypothetical protein
LVGICLLLPKNQLQQAVDQQTLQLFRKCNWLGGTLSGPKRPIFRHTSQIFLTVALLQPTKIRFVWQKMVTFLSQTRPR